MGVQIIEIPLSNGFKIVAEKSLDADYPGEIYIGVVDPDGAWHQDLVIVRNNKPNANSDDDIYEVLVYADRYDEDYTNKFEIKRWEDSYEKLD